MPSAANLRLKAEITALEAAARAGDPAAIERLTDLGGVDTGGVSRGGNKDAGVRNAARASLRKIGMTGGAYATDDSEKSTVGAKLGRAAKSVGKVASALAPAAVLIPGVGALGAAAIGAGGRAVSGGNLGQIAGAGARGFIGGSAINAAKSALAARGAAGAAGAAGTAAAPAAAAGGGGIGGLASRALDFAKANPAIVGGAIGAINSAGQQAKGANAVDRASGIALNDYNMTNPLRRRAVEMLSQPLPQARDLSYLNDSANPFARRPSPVAPVALVAPSAGRMTRY